MSRDTEPLGSFSTTTAYVFVGIFAVVFIFGLVFMYCQGRFRRLESGGIRRQCAIRLVEVAETAREGECPICLEELGEEEEEGLKMIAYCRHVFHTNCIQRWLEQQLRCPVCRRCCERCEEVELVTLPRGEEEDGEVM